MKADTIEQVQGPGLAHGGRVRPRRFAALVERTRIPRLSLRRRGDLQRPRLRRAAVGGGDITGHPQALLAEWVEAMTGGPGVVVFRKAFDYGRRRCRVRPLLGHDRRAAASHTAAATTSPSPVPTTASGMPQEALLRDPAVFAAIRRRDRRARQRGRLGPPTSPPRRWTSSIRASAQSPHRDSHLGLQAPEVIERSPAHVRRPCNVLTLQARSPNPNVGRDRPDPMCPTRKHTSGLFATGRAKLSPTISTGTTYRSPSPRATRRFSIRPSSVPRQQSVRDVRRMANLLQAVGIRPAMESVDRTR